ncbi:LuxR family transcriptional regulator [Tenacibaculum sp. SZ-18]|uniref:two-component regulator propeller domain-containing protein n=1 Tax=Tenacibaculum sp. SZ-18 TaxID=754423 RepID=UPI000C2D095C|nr:LuxR C-terminal-related transcriptional regulator [Tenacibaculum sp. SZ-18]AUC15251.1 LuxR family transcriptional regulator [Tenacibaculum sp. SZ-18]
MSRSSFFTLFLLFVILKVNSQELPLINRFSPENYHAESQNWSISQSENGYIYVANNKGLLEFNGASWDLYPTPNQTIMRSVKAHENKIFTGFYMDFGYWQKDEFGILNYTSLVKENNIKLLSDEQFWNIIELDGWILFQSLQRIYIYNLSSDLVKVINSDSTITKMFKVDDSVYFQKFGKGIFKIEKGISKLLSDKKELRDNIVVLIYKNNQKLVFLTQGNGFYTTEDEFELNSELTKFLKDKSIYNAKQLSDGSFVIGTISNGAFYLKSTGEIQYVLNQENGLSNNTVLTTFEDKKGDIWLGLDNGINKIDVTSSFRIFKDPNGTLGTVYTASYFNGYLYLGTNQGLFAKKYPSSDKFSFIKNTQGQVWSLDIVDDTLFCGHNNGTFIVNNTEVNLISTIDGAWGVKQISNNKLLQGNYDGLYIMEKSSNGWMLSHKIEGFNNSCKFFEIHHNNTVFVNHEYKGVYKLKIDQDFKNVLDVKIDSSITKGVHSSIVKYQNNIIYAYKGGVFRYFDKAGKFARDTMLDKLILKEDFLSGKIIFDKQSNKLFSFSQENINYLRPDKFSAHSIITRKGVSNSLRKGAVGYENIQMLPENKYLLGTLNGYILTDLKVSDKLNYELSITGIKNNSVNGAPKQLKLYNDNTLELSPKYNSLEFSYSVPYLSTDAPVKYQYQLEGYTNDWSNWSYENKVLFENLFFGEYKFKVRAKIGDDLVENIPSYEFIINRAWYISNFAIAGYVLIVFVFSLFMDRLYKRYYRKQREDLLRKQEREFQLKSLESEKELMEIRNTQLKQDVDSKNRELAVSTMSMIKKNELLSSLKKEIMRGDEKSLKQVIKIIDNNLNDTDDWQMFKEAFNNADKDFINKLKKMHNNLTPNDLRLCAYLRLNLSSKEIAPLLNISPRSVEVKRYRLRKKIDLPHNVNLTNYILDI